MNRSEFFSVLSLSFVSASRIFGLCMLLPVLPLYASNFSDASPLWIGLALGIYGFPQAILQIPAGRLSDRYGRKPVIIGGLLIFLLGTLIAAFSTSILGLLIGRFFQGAGAISSSIIALMTDLVRPDQRAKGMAVFGVTIGVSFCLAMVAGPFIASEFGLAGIFGLTAIMACLSIVIIKYIVPNPVQKPVIITQIESIFSLVKNTQVLSLSLGVFVLHLTLMGIFVTLPTLFQNHFSISMALHGWIYLVLLFVAFLVMLPLIFLGEKKRCLGKIVPYGIGILMLSTLWIAFLPTQLIWILIGAWLYFFSFNFLEASLPALLSQNVPASSKGSALGIYSACQFLGAGSGGLISGLFLEFTTYQTIMILCCTLSAIWLMIAIYTQYLTYSKRSMTIN